MSMIITMTKCRSEMPPPPRMRPNENKTKLLIGKDPRHCYPICDKDFPTKLDPTAQHHVGRNAAPEIPKAKEKNSLQIPFFILPQWNST